MGIIAEVQTAEICGVALDYVACSPPLNGRKIDAAEARYVEHF
jgi:hypothetical protein